MQHVRDPAKMAAFFENFFGLSTQFRLLNSSTMKAWLTRSPVRRSRAPQNGTDVLLGESVDTGVDDTGWMTRERCVLGLPPAGHPDPVGVVLTKPSDAFEEGWS